MSYSARIAQMMPPEHIPQHVASASFTGFKCARHAAAEIAAEADATIAELVAALEAAEPQLIGPARLAALAALANAKRT